MSLHCLGKAGYPTNSSSPFQLHGSPNTNSSLCSTQNGKLPDLHSGHEDALSLSWNLCIDFDKVERCGRAQGWEPLRGRALQWQRLGELQNHKKIDIFRIDLCEFLLSCCVHSHSRAQVSISLSSMEAEILAATSLLVGGIQLKLKQLLQFLLGDNGGLSNSSKVQMWLRLDSTSTQGFFNRLGPGRAKHLSTRMMWSQQAMRKRWFLVERISTKENPADLNTKPLSRERREYLMKKIGLCSETFEEKPNNATKVKQVVRLVTAMLMAGYLQGCDGDSMWWTRSMASTWMNPLTWTSTTRWTLTTIALVSLVTYLLNKINKLKIQMVLAEVIRDQDLRPGTTMRGKHESGKVKAPIEVTSSTAQGGGGSFKNRKPIGEVGCCESGMAERSHWWTERCLRSPLFLSLSLTIYLPTYLPIYLSIYLSIYVSIYLCIYLSIDLSLSLSLSSKYISIYLTIYLSICLSIYLSIYPSIYLSISLSLSSVYLSSCLPVYLSIYLSAYLSTCHLWCSVIQWNVV